MLVKALQPKNAASMRVTLSGMFMLVNEVQFAFVRTSVVEFHIHRFTVFLEREVHVVTHLIASHVFRLDV